MVIKMNVPKLRFSEFNNDYVINTFDNLINIIDGDRGNNYPKASDFYDDEYCLFLNAGNVTKKGFNFSNKYFITLKKDNELKNGKLKRNDVVLTTRGTVGNVALYDYSIPFENIRINSGMVINRIKNDKILLPQYLYRFMQSTYFEYQIKKTNFGSAQPQLTKSGITKFTIAYPCVKEQRLLDRKIELQSQKIEALKLYKKGLINLVKNDWENFKNYKINDIFKITRGVVIPKNKLSEEKNEIYKYPVYSSQTSNNGILGYDKIYDYDGKYLTWTTDGANAGKVFYRDGKFRCTNVCGILYEDNPLFTNEFVCELLNYETPKHVSYVGNPKLMNNVMENIDLKLPNNDILIKTSKLISLFNKKLENETTKLMKLHNLKKGLIQNMFV